MFWGLTRVFVDHHHDLICWFAWMGGVPVGSRAPASHKLLAFGHLMLARIALLVGFFPCPALLSKPALEPSEVVSQVAITGYGFANQVILGGSVGYVQ